MNDSIPATFLSRRSVLALGLAGAATAVLAACAGPAGPRISTAQATLPTYRKARAAIGAKPLVSSVPGVQDIYTAPATDYWQSVTSAPGTGDTVKTFQMLWFSPPAPVSSNPVWKQIDKTLNIKFDPTLASGDNYNNKLATVLASGQLPDLMFVQDQVAVGAQAFNEGAFADLSDYLSGDKILKYPNLANLPTYAWKASLKKGRIMGIPHVNPAVTSSATIRTDVMKAAGWSKAPTTGDDLAAMFEAVSKLGTVAGKQLWAIGGLGTFQIEEFTRWMHGIPTDWAKTPSGKLVSYLETDEYEASLAYLRDLWRRGVFHPDGVALGSDAQRSKEKQLWTEGHLAFEFDNPPWLAQQGIQQVEEGTRGAEVEFLLPPSVAGHQVAVAHDPGYWGIVAMSSEAARDPKRVKELLGICNFWAAPYGTKEALFVGSGIEGYNYTFGAGHAVVQKDDAQALTNLQGLYWLGASAPSYIVLDAANAKRKDNLLTTLETLTKAAKTDPTVGLFSQTQLTKSAQLTSLHDDWRTKIVTGREPLSAIKEWRSQWKSGGGDQIRTEFEKALRDAK
jgi:putative aldouronate transport system substrate-binding protein